MIFLTCQNFLTFQKKDSFIKNLKIVELTQTSGIVFCTLEMVVDGVRFVTQI